MFFLHFSFASYNAWFNATLILPSENLASMVEKFLDHNKRKLIGNNDSDGNESGKKAMSL